jgi:hypothetical protein
MFKAGEWAVYAPEGDVPEHWLQRVGRRVLVLEDEQPGVHVTLYSTATGVISVKAAHLRHEVTLNHAYSAVLRRLEVARGSYNDRLLVLLQQAVRYLETYAQTKQSWLAVYEPATVLEPLRKEIDRALAESDAIRTR